jgi:hypothetical protein
MADILEKDLKRKEKENISWLHVYILWRENFDG